MRLKIVEENMNIDKVSFYNVGALEPIPGQGEYGLVIFPTRVRKYLNECARYVAQGSVVVEI